MSKHKFYRNKFLWIIAFFVSYVIGTFIYYCLLARNDWFLKSGFWEMIWVFLYAFAFVPSEVLNVIFLMRELIALKHPSVFTLIALVAGAIPFVLMALSIRENGYFMLVGWSEYGMIFTAIVWLCWIGDFVRWKLVERKKRKAEKNPSESVDDI